MRATASIGLFVSAVALAQADGGFMGKQPLDARASGWEGAASTHQKGVIIQLPEGREALLLQTTYHGPAEDFAWVIPVPGKPSADDIFVASPYFIQSLTDATNPRVETRLGGRRPGLKPGLEMMGEEGEMPEGMAGQLAESVVIHERTEVGSYDATVLSARRKDVLAEWLSQNGYAVPEGSDRILNHYVGKSWYFVALKMRPSAVAERPLLEDVEPIGIRFETEKLVYPLYISRISSRQKTALLLIALTENPVECEQLAEAELPLRKWIEDASCYATFRRELAERGEPALVCEYRGAGGMPFADLYYDRDAWSGPEGSGWSASRLWTTRWWTMLDIEEMEDLSFRPSEDQRTAYLTVVRHGNLKTPLLRFARSRWPALLVAALGALALACGIRVGFKRPATPTGESIAGALTVLGIVFVLGGLLASVGAAGSDSWREMSRAREQLRVSLRQLDDMLTRFRETNGCYPARLKDMTGRRPPVEGVDSSGNVVPTAPGSDARGPLGQGEVVARLPVDPLTGRRHTWAYEPTGTPMVDSGGYAIALKLREPDEGERPRTRYGQEGLFWNQDRGYSLPLGDPDDQVLAAGRTALPASALRRYVRTREGLQLIVADVSRHAAMVPEPEPHIDAVAWSPDGERVAYAQNVDRNTNIIAGGLFDQPSRAQFLLKRPWPAEVRDLDWHPTDDRWLIVAREFEPEQPVLAWDEYIMPAMPVQSVEPPRAYVMDRDGLPQPVPGSDGAITARFAPDGHSVLAVIAPESEHAVRDDGKPRVGSLWRLSLDGARNEKLADGVLDAPVATSSAGCLFVLSAHGVFDTGLIHVDGQGEVRNIDLPASDVLRGDRPSRDAGDMGSTSELPLVVDAWLGDHEVIAVIAAYVDPGQGDHGRMAVVSRRAIPEGVWARIAEDDLLRGANEEPLRAEQIRVLGRDQPTGAVVLSRAHRRGNTYALRAREPRIELLTNRWRDNPERLVEVEIDGKPMTATVEGIYWPNAFQPGDLVALRALGEKPQTAGRVERRDGQYLIVNGRRLALVDEGQPLARMDGCWRARLRVR